MLTLFLFINLFVWLFGLEKNPCCWCDDEPDEDWGEPRLSCSPWIFSPNKLKFYKFDFWGTIPLLRSFSLFLGTFSFLGKFSPKEQFFWELFSFNKILFNLLLTIIIMNGECIGWVILVQFFLYHHFSNWNLFILSLDHAHRIRVRPLVLFVNVHIRARGFLWTVLH